MATRKTKTMPKMPAPPDIVYGKMTRDVSGWIRDTDTFFETHEDPVEFAEIGKDVEVAVYKLVGWKTVSTKVEVD